MGEKEWDVFVHFFQRLGEQPAVKIIAGFFIWLMRLMFGSFRPAYGVICLLWIVDTSTGYYHAWANPDIVPESRRMYHGLVKILIYYFLMFLGYQMAQIGPEMMIVVQATIEMAIGITESKSILENLKKIGTLKKWPAALMALIDQLLKIFEGKYREVIDIGGKNNDKI